MALGTRPIACLGTGAGPASLGALVLASAVSACTASPRPVETPTRDGTDAAALPTTLPTTLLGLPVIQPDVDLVGYTVEFSPDPQTLKFPRSRVLINGQAVVVHLDTGSTGTSLSAAAARRAGVSLTSTEPIAVTTPRGEQIHYEGFVREVEIGEHRIRDVPCLVGGQGPGAAADSLDGIIGADVLGAFTLQLNAAQDSITLLQSREGAVEPSHAATTFEVERGTVSVAATLRGRGPYRCFLDTGAVGAAIVYVAPHVAAEIGVTQLFDLKSGNPEEFIFPLGEVVTGDVTLGGVNGMALAAEVPMNGFDCVLSLDLFKGRWLTIDFRTHTLRVGPPRE